MVLRLSDLGSLEPRVLLLEQKDDRDDALRCVDDVFHMNCEKPEHCQDHRREVKNTKEITQKNQTDSPLLRLPAELRNHIYRLAFTGTVVAINKPHTKKDNMLTTYSSVRALMYTCSQVYCEANYFMFDLTLFVPSYFALRFFYSSNMCAAGIGNIRECRITNTNRLAICTGRISPQDLQPGYSALRRVYVGIWGTSISKRAADHDSEELRIAFGIPHLQIVWLTPEVVRGLEGRAAVY